MIVEKMHPWTKEALHNIRTSISVMLTCLETHITCIVLLALLRFIVCSIFSNFTEACVMTISLTENAISWCERSSIAWGPCNISTHWALVARISWFPFETIALILFLTLILAIPIISSFLFMWWRLHSCIIGAHVPYYWFVDFIWFALFAYVLCFFLNVNQVCIKFDKSVNAYFLSLCFNFYFLFFPFSVCYMWNFSSISIRNELFSISSLSKSKL